MPRTCLPLKALTPSLAGVLGESGDLSGYAHGNSLLRHAGLNLAEASSGKWRGQMKLSKRGRPRFILLPFK
jgi:transposase